jgi:hypothetical protein
MKERPIIFSDEMVRAILAGRKTQTRRVIRMRDGSLCDDTDIPANEGTRAPYVMDFSKTFPRWRQLDCPYGAPGDRLWVKETWADAPNGMIYRANFNLPDGFGSEVVDLRTGKTIPLKWKSSRFMPKKLARLWLEIISVRVERLQEIKPQDMVAEGTGVPVDPDGCALFTLQTKPQLLSDYVETDPRQWTADDYLRAYFGHLWDTINFKRGCGWDINPLVWVIQFRRLEAEIATSALGASSQ